MVFTMRFGFLGLAIALALLGCNSSSSESATKSGSAAGSKELQIAVIPKGATHEYWKSIHAGAQRAADELKGIQILWKGPLKENDLEDQIKVVEDFTTKKVDGIVLAPLHDTSLSTPVNDAINAGIPVVIIDSGLQNVKAVSFVATDNYKAGQLGGQKLATLLGGKGRVVMLRYEVGSASTDARERGFLDGVKGAAGIHVISSDQYGGVTTETAQKAAENLLARFNGQIDGIFTPNESTTFGMLRALENANLAGKVKFVGFDASDALVQGLKKGEINGLVVQNPEKMGYLGVKILVDSIQGKPVQDKIDTGATVVDAQNMSKPDVAKLLAPPKI